MAKAKGLLRPTSIGQGRSDMSGRSPEDLDASPRSSGYKNKKSDSNTDAEQVQLCNRGIYQFSEILSGKLEVHLTEASGINGARYPRRRITTSEKSSAFDLHNYSVNKTSSKVALIFLFFRELRTC
ncbi:hypothetical protein NPIL_137391 [Nephila pilipes]|uniref:Uncharacterized protein n=1 Tax=Nephila pilipes TaxID=299642 RepID=A0A8X6PHZ9_NEPPI|nr:hypothetical protein NPIL_137391 [Nephila pilipes]